MSLRKKPMSGSSLVETLTGLTILIPVLLFLIDCAALVIGQTSNDALAKHAARAASEQAPGSGGTAAAAVINSYNTSNSTLCHNATVATTYDPTQQNVTCKTTLVVSLPVPVPFWNYNNITFQAQATEPVVSQLADPTTTGS